MKRQICIAVAASLLTAATFGAVAHEGEHFSAGVPGDAKKPARTVRVVMSDSDGAMKFTPDHFDVKKGEQVRFIIQNKGALKHEFMLASVKDNDKHAEMMKKFPDMEHDDPIAQDFASACSLGDSRYLAEGADGFTSIASYAEHLKKEITFNLSQEDAIKVQTAAANIAQNIARSEVLRRANQQTAAQEKPIQEWCTTVARQFILGLISMHVKKHRKFDLLVRIATMSSRH